MPGHHRPPRSRLEFVVILIALVAAAAGGFVWIRGGAGEPSPAGARRPVGPSEAATETSVSAQETSEGSEGSATPEPEPKHRLVIHGTGDVNIDPSYIPAFRSNGYAYAWTGLHGLFRHDDLTVVNLECAVSTKGSPVPKEFNFRGDPAALPAMVRAGVDVANLGNNHSYDFGPEALVDTVRNVRQAGIAPVGAGANENAALSPAIFDVGGWRIAVLGFDYVVDPYPTAVATESNPGTAAGHDVDAMVRAIRWASTRADLVVVTIHWGIELDTQPREYQIQMAHRFVDAGADIVFGHHSHRLNPMGTYKGKPIFWGLGNFVWPNFSVGGSTTAVAEVVVRSGGRLQGRLLPAYIEAPGHPVLR